MTPSEVTTWGGALGTFAVAVLTAVFTAWNAARSKQANHATDKSLERGNSAFADLRQTDAAQGEKIAALDARLRFLEHQVEQMTARNAAQEARSLELEVRLAVLERETKGTAP
jgi:TolA-binding protein